MCKWCDKGWVIVGFGESVDLFVDSCVCAFVGSIDGIKFGLDD